MSETLTDIAGRVIEPGDPVVYPQQSGRSVQMMLGRLVSYDGKTAQIERVEGSRWDKNIGGERRWRDKRTGKGIDPYTKSGKHYRVPPREFWVHAETGEEITYQQFQGRFPSTWMTPLQRQDYAMWRRSYDQGEWHDYVEEYVVPARPVTIHNVSNIVKVVPKEEA